MHGSDPPSSKAPLFMDFPHSSATFFPPTVLPTNLIERTRES